MAFSTTRLIPSAELIWPRTSWYNIELFQSDISGLFNSKTKEDRLGFLWILDIVKDNLVLEQRNIIN